jgi:hypothetical protein
METHPRPVLGAAERFPGGESALRTPEFGGKGTVRPGRSAWSRAFASIDAAKRFTGNIPPDRCLSRHLCGRRLGPHRGANRGARPADRGAADSAMFHVEH